jgi:O-antigen/teichoic acid export membrane protein
MLRPIRNRIRHDANLKDLLRNSGILYAGGLVSLALTFAQQITTANLLGPDDYGRLAVVLSSSLLIMLVIDFRTWEIGTQLLTRSNADRDAAETVRVTTWLAAIETITGGIGAIIIIFAAPTIAAYLLKSPELSSLVSVFAIAIPFRILAGGVLSVFPRIYGRFDWLAWKSITYSLVRLILMSGAALAGLGLHGVILGAIAGEVFNFGLLLFMALRLYRPQIAGQRLVDFTRPAQFSEGRGMLGQLWISSTLAGLHYQTFIPIMAILTTPAQVGLFRSALDISELLERTIQPLSVVFTPKIIALYQTGDEKAFRRYLKQCAMTLLSVVTPLALGIIVFGPFVLPLLLRVEGYEDIAIVTNIIVAGTSIHAILQWWLRPTAIAMHTVYQQNIAQLILILASFVMMIATVPLYGGLAGGWIKAGLLSCFSLISFLLFLSQSRPDGKQLPAKSVDGKN